MEMVSKTTKARGYSQDAIIVSTHKYSMVSYKRTGWLLLLPYCAIIVLNIHRLLVLAIMNTLTCEISEIKQL